MQKQSRSSITNPGTGMRHFKHNRSAVVTELLEKQTPQQEESYRCFLNLLKVFHNIDAPDLGHIFTDDEEFGSYRTDPFAWFIKNQGDRARALYQLAMERTAYTIIPAAK
tara:strand:- start:249 stop:578 length:330 start_codon:yes stop_codon:yes gene_type:complete